MTSLSWWRRVAVMVVKEGAEIETKRGQKGKAVKLLTTSVVGVEVWGKMKKPKEKTKESTKTENRRKERM